MPLIPKTIDIKQQNTEKTSNIMTKTALSNTINQITNLIKQQKYVLMKSSSSNICGIESSNFNTNEHHNNFHEENNLLVSNFNIIIK